MVSPIDVKYYKSSSGVGLGGTISSTEIASATPNNFFDSISGSEAVAGRTEYRCFFVKNTHLIETIEDSDIFLQSDNPNSAFSSIQWGLEPTGQNHNPNISITTGTDAINLGDRVSLWSQAKTKFSFSLWVYANSWATSNNMNIVRHDATSNHRFTLESIASGDDLDFSIKNSGGTILHAVKTTVSTGVWHHIVCTYDSTLGSQNIKLYVDKVLEGTANLTETINLTGDLNIGSSTGGSIPMDGAVSDFRYFVGAALTQAEIDDIYDDNIDAPTPSYWLKMDEGTGDPVDAISGTLTGTLVGTASWSYIAQKIVNETTSPVGVSWFGVTNGPVSNTPNIGDLAPGAAMPVWVKWIIQPDCPDAANDYGLFTFRGSIPEGGTGGGGTEDCPDGSYHYTPYESFNVVGDVVTQNDAAALDLNNFTVACWFKTSFNYAPAEGTLVRKGFGFYQTDADVKNYFIKINNDPFANEIEAGFEELGGTIHPTFTDGVTWNDGQWHFVSVTYNGTIVSLYVDGVLRHTHNTTATPGTNARKLYIGADPDEPTSVSKRVFHGDIDEVRVWNVALTASQEEDLYKQGVVPQQGSIVYENTFGGSGTGCGGAVPPPVSTGFTFVVAGDWGCETMTTTVVNQIKNINPKLVLGVGDNNYDDDGSISCWLTKIKPIDDVQGSTIRFETAFGNHDNAESATSGTESSTKSHFGYSNTYYSFDIENVHFLVLDNTTETSFSAGSAQHTFASADLAAARNNSAIDWIVVDIHKPMWGASSDHGYNDGNFNQAYAAMFDTYKVDLIVAGHNHNFQQTKQTVYNSGSPTSPTVVASTSPYTGGTGRIHCVSGTGGHDSGSSLYSLGSQPAFQSWQNDSDNGVLKCVLSNNNKTLTCSFINTNNETLQTFVINR